MTYRNEKRNSSDNCRRSFLFPAIMAGLLAAVCAVAGGCTERERAGYSAIPQNSPSGWEMQPFGEIRN